MTTTIEDIKGAGYDVGIARPSAGTASPAVYTVSGAGFDGMTVSASPETGLGWSEDDQAALESLADPAARCEREFQHSRPDAAEARASLTDKGYDVARPDPNVDVFDVAGGTVEATGLDPDGLVAQDDELAPVAEAAPAKAAAKKKAGA